MSSIEATGLKGIQAGLQSASQHAEEIATAFVPESDNDAVGPIVGLIQDQAEVAASSKVVKAGEQITKSVIDLLA